MENAMRFQYTSFLGRFFIISTLAAASLAQSRQALPGCDTAPEVRKVLDEDPNGKELDKLPFADRVAHRREVYEKLIANYPREVEPYRGLIEYRRRMDEYSDPNSMQALQERFRKQASLNPDDPLALYVAGLALFGIDTPESLRLLEASKTKAPQFPWPFLALAEEYSDGKRMDKQRSSENLTAFFALCPDSMDETAQGLVSRNEDLETKVARALRARLAKETDPGLIRNYEMLWSLEFRSRPPQEHDAQRQQVADDLKRIASLNPKPDSEWLAFLIRGYQQAGVAREKITPMEDRLLREYPHSNDAYDIVRDRWNEANKKPEDEKDAVAWAKYHQAYKEALQGWIRDFPDSSYLAHEEWFFAISYDDSLSEKDGIAAVEEFLRYTTVYFPPSPWSQFWAADFMLRHKWQSGRALDLIQQAKPMFDKDAAVLKVNDNLSAEDQDDLEERLAEKNLMLTGGILRAAHLAGRPDAVVLIKQVVEGPPPTQEKLQSDYWWNRARLAVIEGRKQDAQAYYQMSLHTRSEAPQYSEGTFHDDLTDEARALWKEAGGTLVAWAVWSNPPSSKGKELAQGRWEKPEKTLSAFELSDLSGKTWRLNDLKGKVLLINVWATWCGPCNAELPKLERLYEKLKDRSDVQLLTFDIDEDLGLVAPYLKDKGYTFPVLPAYSLVNNLLDGNVPIPQNWIVDPKGKWLWTQFGFGAEDNWAQVMTQKLESAKTSN
jgi:thiol-disulfide isomerase/thioredoxin